MIIIQRRNTHPINMKAHAAIQLWPVGYKLAQHDCHTGKEGLTNTMLLQPR
jgi:hypothetical protein